MISNLHALRAVASLMVVLHHGRGMIEPHFSGVSTLTIGAGGVDIFFVLSGVVITLSAHAHAVPASTFLRQRIIRVVPLWWLALASVMLLLFVGLAPLGLQKADVSALNFVRSMLFLPFERTHGGVMPLLGVGWTLNYEMFFYAIFAILLLAPELRRSLMIVAVMAALVLYGLYFRPEAVMARFYTNPILLEFAVGVLLAQIWIMLPDGSDPAVRAMARRLGILLMMIGLAGFVLAARPDNYSELMSYRVILWGLPAVACVAGAMALERGGLRLASHGCAVLGAASYALYLFHPFVLQAVGKFGGIASAGPLRAVFLFVVAVTLSQLIAIAIHFRIERPMTDFLKRLRFGHSAPWRAS